MVVDGEETWFPASQGDKGTNWAFKLKIARASGTRDGFECSLRRRTLAESVVSRARRASASISPGLQRRYWPAEDVQNICRPIVEVVSHGNRGLKTKAKGMCISEGIQIVLGIQNEGIRV